MTYQTVETPITTEQTSLQVPANIRRISWGSVIAGAVVALVVQIAMNMLGLSIGAIAVSPSVDVSAGTFGTGTVIWLAASSLLSLFAGGLVAGRLAGIPQGLDGVLHGLLTWAVATLFTLVMFVSGAGSIVNSTLNLASDSLALIGTAVEDFSPDVSEALDLQESALQAIQDEVRTINTEAGTPVSVELVFSVANLLRQDAETEDAQETRAAVTQLLVEETGLTRAEAENRIRQWAQEYSNITAQVETTLQSATAASLNAIAIGAGLVFLTLVVGAFAAGSGGLVGSPKEINVQE